MNDNLQGSSTRLFNVYNQPSAQYLVSEPAQVWHDNVTNQLNSLTKLSIGWDGYNGKPVTFENAHFAMRVLSSICQNHTEAPLIVPGVSGDLQIEWHTTKGDIELHIVNPNQVYGWFSEVNTATDVEKFFTSDFTEVSRWVRSIVEAQFALIAAAA